MSGRIGKPVRFRHGPATVIGEPLGTALASHCPGLLGWEGAGGRKEEPQAKASPVETVEAFLFDSTACVVEPPLHQVLIAKRAK